MGAPIWSESPLCPGLQRVPEQDRDGDMKGPPTKVSCFQ